MRIFCVNRIDRDKLAVEVSEADLKVYLTHVYCSLSCAAWEHFVKEGVITTSTAAYYDVDHEKFKHLVPKQYDSEESK